MSQFDRMRYGWAAAFIIAATFMIAAAPARPKPRQTSNAGRSSEEERIIGVVVSRVVERSPTRSDAELAPDLGYCLFLPDAAQASATLREQLRASPVPVMVGEECKRLPSPNRGITLGRIRWLDDDDVRIEVWFGGAHGTWVVRKKAGAWRAIGTEEGWAG